MNKIFVGVVVVLVVLLVAFFVFAPETDEVLLDDELIEEEMVDEEVVVMEFDIQGLDDFSFSMEEMVVNQGDLVRINFTNVGDMPHDLVVEGLGVATSILQNGESETIEFIASETGSFEYYCSVGQHREMGMVGTLMIQ